MLFSCPPCVGLTLEPMSSKMPFGGRRPWTISIHWPEIGNRREVCRCCKPLRLETAHLAWRSRTILRSLAADNPAYGRIMPRALGILAGNDLENAKRMLSRKLSLRVARNAG